MQTLTQNPKIGRLVGEIAAEFPATIPFFESVKIDYCCGGNRTLKDACALAGVPLEQVLDALGEIQRGPSRGPKEETDWNQKSMAELTNYILEKHHSYTRTATSRLRILAEKVARVHGNHHLELLEINGLIQQMGEELEGHMAKEEEQVFPYLQAVEKAGGKKEGIPDPFAGGPMDQHPLKVLMWEHGMTGEEWIQLHQLSRDFTPPEDACGSYRALYEGLRELESDLHRHVHLENNILFPKAVAAGIID
ncbi:MAG TPA: iron-sulfur cluster repair di-iron protein [bacterium]|nr:iron-sulfur cluster repair di-iron protein [bacterium]